MADASRYIPGVYRGQNPLWSGGRSPLWVYGEFHGPSRQQRGTGISLFWNASLFSLETLLSLEFPCAIPRLGGTRYSGSENRTGLFQGRRGTRVSSFRLPHTRGRLSLLLKSLGDLPFLVFLSGLIIPETSKMSHWGPYGL